MQFNKEEKALWLEDWKQSGKSAWSYAKENGLIPQTFCGWVKRETKSAQGFVEIPAPKKLLQEHPQEILVEKGDIRVRIPLAIWLECSASILEGLRG